MERAFNARQGITRRDDRLPQKPEIKQTPAGQQEREQHEELLTAYYQLRGYDLETGIPTRQELERLDLARRRRGPGVRSTGPALAGPAPPAPGEISPRRPAILK